MIIAVNALWFVAPVVGCIMALVTRQRNPRRSTYALIGFAAFAINGAVSTLWSVSLVVLGPTDNPLMGSASTVILSVLRPIAALVGWSMIFMALFWTDRYGQRPLQSAGVGPHHQAVPGQQAPGQPYPGQQPYPGVTPSQHPGQPSSGF